MKNRLEQIELIINQDRHKETDKYNIIPDPAQAVTIFICFFSMAIAVMIFGAGV